LRSLTGLVTTEKGKTKEVSPINIVRIDFGGALGTKYYSDRPLTTPVTAAGTVIDWGDYSQSISEDRGEVSEYSFTMEDDDLGLLDDVFRDQISQGKPAILYQFFIGLGLSDLTVLFKGVVGKAEWSEGEPRQLRISLESTETFYSKRLGTLASEENFPDIRKEDIGKTIPYVYGDVERSSAVQVVASPKTTLAIDLGLIGSETVVTDGRCFPQGVNKDIFIGRELIRGKFEGNKLFIYGRGLVVASGTTNSMSPNILTFTASLVPAGFSWVGYHVRFFLPSGATPERLITNFTTPDVYGMDAPVLVPGTSPGVLHTEIPAGTPFEIFGKPAVHGAGEEVYLDLPEYKWAINDAVSDSVDFIEIAASVVLARDDVSSKLKDLNTIIKIPKDYYTVDLSDSSFTGTIGHDITTISMPFDPKNLPNSPFASDEILASLRGRDLDNPADIIDDILTRSDVTDKDTTSISDAVTATSDIKLGFTIEEIRRGIELAHDIAFQSRLSLIFEAGDARLLYLTNAAGTSTTTVTDSGRAIDGLDITQEDIEQIYNVLDITYKDKGKEKSFEVRNTGSVTEHGERPRDLFFWVHNNRSSAEAIAIFWLGRWADAVELATFETFLNTLEVERGDWLTLSFTDFYTSKKGRVINIIQTPGHGENNEIDRIQITARTTEFGGCSGSCQLFGETGCDTSCEATCQSSPETSCNFACETACQEACELTCVSSCQLSCTEFVQTLAPDDPDTGGCGTSCQGACQTGCQGQGCEATACQTGCTSTGCTVGCETNCQSTCEFSCEVGCTTGCEFDCQSGCQNQVETACATGCETGCQGFCTTNCQTGCTSSCELDCQLDCQTNCQVSSCTTSCEVDCQISCESSGCQAACEATGCQISCTAACEASACQSTCEATGCQASCQAGGCEAVGCEATGCQACCENTCQNSCQDACQTGTCQMSCTTDCQQGSCQGSCTSGCEMNCQGGCEGSCQDCCQFDGTETSYTCETSCQTDCTQSCETSCQEAAEVLECTHVCQAFCQTGCQAGCEIICQTGCQCDCQLGCEGQCQSGCQISCTCACQSTDETTGMCTAANQAGCFTACQTGFQTECQTSCQVECQGFCQTGCQSGCEIICQIGCQCNCQANVETVCQTGCQTTCQCECQSEVEVSVGACDGTGCQGGACTTGAQLSFCATTCQITGCTTQCQSFCECDCTTEACVVACQSFCQTGCQVGCEAYCTVGCQCDCQATCQSSCRSGGCEELCQCTCQTAVQI